MKNATRFYLCLGLMMGIALSEYKPIVAHPLNALDRTLAAIADQTDLMKTLHAAERAAKGEL